MFFAVADFLGIVPKLIFLLGICVSIALFFMGTARKSKLLTVLAFAFLIAVVWWTWKGGADGLGTGNSTGIGLDDGHDSGAKEVNRGSAPPEAVSFPGPDPPRQPIGVVIVPAETGVLDAENEYLRRQLAERNETISAAQNEIARLRALCDRQSAILSRLGSGPHPAALYLRYTGTGDPDFSVQITPAVQIRRDTAKEFNDDLAEAFESLAGLPQFRFNRLCIENAGAPGASQVEEAVRLARNSFPGIRIETIDRK